MKRGHKVFLVTAAAIVLIVASVILTNQTALTGYAIHSGGCGTEITTSGDWELDGDLTCTNSSNGLTISASDTTLNCQDNSIIGDQNANAIALIISTNLTNIKLTNCNILNFTTQISTESNLEIENTNIEEITNCVEGNWTDLGGNSGCLDTTGPTINIENQTLEENQTLSYTIDVTDPSGIANLTLEDLTNYTIEINVTETNSTENNQTNSTSNETEFSTTESNNPIFTLEANTITSTELPIAIYTLEITVQDTKGYESTETLTVTVTEVTIEEESTSNDNGNSNEDNNDNSDSSSSGSDTKKTTKQESCGQDVAWTCTDWNECGDDGFERRTCKKTSDKCNDPLPLTKRACTTTEKIEEPETQENIVDVNTGEENPDSVALTGKSIGPLEKLNLSGKILSIGAIAVIAVGFILTLVLGKRKKIRQSTRILAHKPTKGKKTKDDNDKLYSWEDKN